MHAGSVEQLRVRVTCSVKFLMAIALLLTASPGTVQVEMKETLWQISKEGFFYYAKTARDKWIADNLGMVTLSGSQVWWTWETEDTFLQVLICFPHLLLCSHTSHSMSALVVKYHRYRCPKSAVCHM